MTTLDATPASRRTAQVAVSWARQRPGGAIITVVDAAETAGGAVADLAGMGIDVTVAEDAMRALVQIGRDQPDAVLVNADIAGASLAEFVEIVHGDLEAPVLIAYRPTQVKEIGAAVLAVPGQDVGSGEPG